MEAVQRTLDLEEDHPHAFALLSWLALLREDFDRAVELTDHAVVLEPGNPEHVAEYAYALMYAGRAEEAIAAVERAMRLSPINPAWYLLILGTSYYAMRERDSAEEKLRECIARQPDSVWGRLYLISVLIDAGFMEDARQLAREVMRIEHSFSVTRSHLTKFKDGQFRKKLTDNLLEAGLPK